MTTSYTGDDVVVFYVDGENGDDANSDTDATTLSTAWKTIAHAFSRIKDGAADSPDDGAEIRIVKTSDDSIYYSETTTTELDWSSKEILIIGAASDGTVDGTRPTIHGKDLGVGENFIWDLTVKTIDNSNFANLIFDGGDASNCHHCIHHSETSSHNVKWVNCRFTQAVDHGYDLDDNTNYVTWINCQFDNNGGDGVYNSQSNYALVYKCLFNDNATIGCYFGYSSRIVQSVFYNNGSHGLRVSASGGAICGCVFESNTGNGLNVGGTAGSTLITDCVSTGNGGVGWNINTSAETHMFNCHSYGNSYGEKDVGATDYLIMYNLGNTSDPGWVSKTTYDFTPTGSSDIVGGGLETPFLYMGTTSADAGINKFRTSPYQLREARRY